VFILDTDVLSYYSRGGYPTLTRRILATPPEHLWITIITVDERLQGAYRLINDIRRPDGGMGGCRLLREAMRDLSDFQILPYDSNARQIFNRLSAPVRRNGANDCKIAAIACTRGFTVITHNVQHFQEIQTGCSVLFEDWTVDAT